jgi:uncharacterized protein (TIGR03067 family)
MYLAKYFAASLFLSLVITGSAFSQDAVEKERQRFVGTWTVESFELDGLRATQEQLKEWNLRFMFTEKTCKILADDTISRARGVSSESPAHDYDLTLEKSVNGITMVPFIAAGIELEGIYRLEGDVLKLCFSENGVRPEGFPDNSADHRVIVLRRIMKR